MVFAAKNKMSIEDKKKAEQRSLLREDMMRLKEELRQIETEFNYVTDENLIESIIYEHKAKSAKLSYLLAKARQI